MLLNQMRKDGTEIHSFVKIEDELTILFKAWVQSRYLDSRKHVISITTPINKLTNYKILLKFHHEKSLFTNDIIVGV